MSLAYDSLPSPDRRFDLKEVIGTGVCSKVYRAIDKEANRVVAIKCQRYEKDMIIHINEEYRILRDFSSHPNLPDFYGVYRKQFTTAQTDEIWFILEFCEAGPVIDIIRSLQTINKRISEEHIGYILSETAKAIIHLHANNVIHRDIRGSNILMTKEGEIKLCDFGLSRDTRSTDGKRSTCVGSPSVAIIQSYVLAVLSMLYSSGWLQKSLPVRIAIKNTFMGIEPMCGRWA